MKFLSRFIRSRYPLAIGAGLLLAASFPNFGIAGFGWIAPGLMLAIALGKRGKESFRLGYVAGLAHNLTALSWLLNIPYRWHGIPFGPALGWLALGAFLAVFPATWVWLALKVSGVRCPAFAALRRDAQVSGDGAVSNWLEQVKELNSLQGWGARTWWALICAMMWVALEMVIARIFSGFPWNLLGASQFRLVFLIQIASFTGVYGVSFLLVWTSISLLNAVAVILHRPHLRSIWLGEIILPLGAVMAAFAFGLHEVSHSPKATRELKVTMVQPSIPQALIWDEANDQMRFQNLIHLSEQALTNDTDVLMWPEGAVPRPLRYVPEIAEAITNLAGSHRVWMIVGSDDFEPRKGSTDPQDREYYNSSFLISPDGRLMNRYIKRNLVIFGEYIPLEHVLPFIKFLTPWMPGSFTPGKGPVPFEMEIPQERRSPGRRDSSDAAARAGPEAGAPSGNTFRVKTSVLICFEDNFPHYVREYAGSDIDFLVNLTNNGWFGEGAAQWQHAANAVFRTVENRRPLVRCTNNGLTCWVDACGRLRQVFKDPNGSVYGPGFMTAEIPLPALDQKATSTFYNQHGDWFGWGCAALSVIALALKLLRKNP